MKIKIETVGNYTLGKNNYLASGGEAAVYKIPPYAVKVYHDSQRAIPEGKIAELKAINIDNVLRPLYKVYDIKQNMYIGYAMAFIDTSHPLCKLFTKSFKNSQKISNDDIVNLVKKLQSTVVDIHGHKCLIGDFNEMNLLVSGDFKMPYFIDTDSWQTPSYRAVAYNESVRDHTVKIGVFNENTDWYAFGILAFQLYIGIHPYRGGHPAYTGCNTVVNGVTMPVWQDRMEKGISAFDKQVSLPAVCNDLSVIPKKHADWMKNVLANKERSAPPDLDKIEPVLVPHAISIIKANANFDVDEVYKFPERIRDMVDILGIKYFAGTNTFFQNKKEMFTGLSKYRRVYIMASNESEPVVCGFDGKNTVFHNINGTEIGNIASANGMFRKDQYVYTLNNGTLVRNTFMRFSNKIVHMPEPCADVCPFSSYVHDGMIFEDVLGKPWFSVFNERSNYTFQVPELDGYRVLSCSSKDKFVVVIGEKNGVYDRFVFVLEYGYSGATWKCIKETDVTVDSINMTTTQSGMMIMVVNGNGIVLMRDASAKKEIAVSPVDASNYLYCFGKEVFFTDDKTVYSMKMK